MRTTWYFILLACFALFQCQGGVDTDTEESDLSQISTTSSHRKESFTVIEGGDEISCQECDSIVSTFPNNKIAFNNRYGYDDSLGGGIRYSYYERDIDLYFTCVQECDTLQPTLSIALLATLIEYEPDASNQYHFNLLKYINLHPEFLPRFEEKYGAGKLDKLINFIFSPLNTKDQDFVDFCKQVNLLSVKSPDDKVIYRQFCEGN